jgi:hypothetical protein
MFSRQLLPYSKRKLVLKKVKITYAKKDATDPLNTIEGKNTSTKMQHLTTK